MARMRTLWLLLIVQAIALVRAQTIANNKVRIVGGQPVTTHHKHAVVVRINSILCGGSLLSMRHVATAAHCVRGQQATSISIRAGTMYSKTGGSTRRVEQVWIHPKYNSTTFNNDIAMLKLITPFDGTTGRVQPIQLCTSEPAAGEEVNISGWGKLGETEDTVDIMHEVDVKLVSRENCSLAYKTAIEPSMICAASPGKDACQGDSGGPLTHRGCLLGLVSYGIGCARPQFPGVYAYAPHFRNFINYYLSK